MPQNWRQNWHNPHLSTHHPSHVLVHVEADERLETVVAVRIYHHTDFFPKRRARTVVCPRTGERRLDMGEWVIPNRPAGVAGGPVVHARDAVDQGAQGAGGAGATQPNHRSNG